MKIFTQDFLYLKDELQFLDKKYYLYQNYQQQQFQAFIQCHNLEAQKKEQQIALFYYNLSQSEMQEKSSYISLQCSQQNQQLLLIKNDYLKTFKY